MSTVSSTTAQDVLARFARKADSQSAQESSQMKFLTLLTTQLKNQDPMNPLDNAQVTSQLAQISTVDGIERLNTMLGNLVSGQQASETMQAAALVGRGVLVPGKGLTLTDAGAVGGFALDGPADKVTVTIKDANGLDVASVDLGAFEPGTHNFHWDGSATGGQRAANGRYTISFSATQGENKLAPQALQLGSVSSVVRGPRGTDLQVGELGIFQMADIKQIL